MSTPWDVAEGLALLERARAEGSEWALRRTVAVYARVVGGVPVPHGSGVLLRIAKATFLVSASHVLFDRKNPDERELFITSGLPGSAFTSLGGLDVKASHDQDDVDVAFVRLSPEVESAMAEHREFVQMDELDLCRNAEQGLYGVVGFPQSYSTRDHAAKTIEPRAIYIGAARCDPVPDLFTPGVSIALWHQHVGIDEDGSAQRVPDLYGVSGCGIWRMITSDVIERRQPWTPSSLRLTGIEHSVLPNRHIKGILMSYVIASIRREHSDLRSAIDLYRPT
jgi:hypothetical protein